MGAASSFPRTFRDNPSGTVGLILFIDYLSNTLVLCLIAIGYYCCYQKASSARLMIPDAIGTVQAMIRQLIQRQRLAEMDYFIANPQNPVNHDRQNPTFLETLRNNPRTPGAHRQIHTYEFMMQLLDFLDDPDNANPPNIQDQERVYNNLNFNLLREKIRPSNNNAEEDCFVPLINRRDARALEETISASMTNLKCDLPASNTLRIPIDTRYREDIRAWLRILADKGKGGRSYTVGRFHNDGRNNNVNFVNKSDDVDKQTRDAQATGQITHTTFEETLRNYQPMGRILYAQRTPPVQGRFDPAIENFIVSSDFTTDDRQQVYDQNCLQVNGTTNRSQFITRTIFRRPAGPDDGEHNPVYLPAAAGQNDPQDIERLYRLAGTVDGNDPVPRGYRVLAGLLFTWIPVFSYILSIGTSICLAIAIPALYSLHLRKHPFQSDKFKDWMIAFGVAFILLLYITRAGWAVRLLGRCMIVRSDGDIADTVDKGLYPVAIDKDFIEYMATINFLTLFFATIMIQIWR